MSGTESPPIERWSRSAPRHHLFDRVRNLLPQSRFRLRDRGPRDLEDTHPHTQRHRESPHTNHELGRPPGTGNSLHRLMVVPFVEAPESGLCALEPMVSSGVCMRYPASIAPTAALRIGGSRHRTASGRSNSHYAGATTTVTTAPVLPIPLDAVMVKVSVVDPVAAARWPAVGVKVNAPVPESTLTVPPPVEVPVVL